MAIQTFVASTVLTAAQMNALQGNDYNQTVSTKTASYTLVAADKGTRIAMNSASATTITVNTSLFAAGDTLEIVNISSGVCTLTAGSATVSTSGSLALAANAGGTLYFTSAGVSVFLASSAATAAPTSRVWVHTANGYGSTGTAIPKWTTTQESVGSDITFANSASAGSSFTINTAGSYSMSFSFTSPLGANQTIGISLNQATLTQNANAIAATERLAYQKIRGDTGDTMTASVSVTKYLAVNDVIRPVGSGTSNNPDTCLFIIQRNS